MDNSLINERTREKELHPHPKLDKISIPKSTENMFVIPCNPSGYGFIILDSTKEYLRNIPTYKINKTIRELNKRIDIVLNRKKDEEVNDYHENSLIAMKSLLSFGIFTGLVMYILAYFDVKDYRNRFIIVPFIILLITIFAALFLMLKVILTQRIFIDKDEEVSKTIDHYIDKQNYNYYQQRGYVLEKGDMFCWLSIKKVF